MRLLAWSGGVAFVASLAVTGYVLGAVWPHVPSRPAADVPAALVRNALLFTLFAIHHSVLARTGVKRRIERLSPVLADRSVYVWVASALLALTVVAWQPVGHPLWDLGSVGRAAAWLLQAVGVGLMLLAGRVIDPLELVGIHPATNSRLEASGPYLLVRHPLYLGLLLVLWSTPVMTGDRLAFATLSTFYIAAAIPWEEAAMRRAVGQAYDRYCMRVRWRVIPGLF